MTDIVTTAEISRCGKYRYELTRTWAEDAPKMCFVMLNPSTADATEDDPTIRRCVGFARNRDLGGIIVWNLFAWRATHPSELTRCEDPTGPRNPQYLSRATLRAAAGDTVVAAWGAYAGLDGANTSFVARFGLAQEPLYRLGPPLKHGRPRHPLYVPYSMPLELHGGLERRRSATKER